MNRTCLPKAALLLLCVWAAWAQRPLLADQAETDERRAKAATTFTAQVPPGQPVPHVVTLSSSFQRIVIARFKYQTDLLEGLQEAVRREKIKNAVILSGIGSVTSYHLHTVSNTTMPPEDVFYKAEGPYDVTGVGGYVINGRVHCHITLTNEQNAIGGHLEPGTRAFAFVAITLGVFGDEVNLERLDDNTWR